MAPSTASKRHSLIPPALWLLTALQAFCLGGAWYLEKLSQEKVGVNHHVLYRKRQYLQSILSDELMTVYQAVLLLILIILIIVWFRQRSRRRILMPLLVSTGLLFLALSLPAFRALNTFVYALVLVGVVWLLELLKTTLRCLGVSKS